MRRAVLTAALLLLLALRGEAYPPTPCNFSPPDAGCVFFEHWDNGTFSGNFSTVPNPINLPAGWSWNGGGGPNNIVQPGLNGTAWKVHSTWPVADTGNWYDAGFNMPRASGEKFWVEWWTTYDINYRWAGGDAAKQCSNSPPPPGCSSYCDATPSCLGSFHPNSSHKDFDFLGAEIPGRILFHVDEGTGACSPCPATLPPTVNVGGSLGAPEMYFFGDKEPCPPFPCNQPDGAGNTHHLHFPPNVTNPSFKLQPGQTYHFVLEVTNGYKPNWDSLGTVGAFKLWINNVKYYDYTNVGTCANPTGTCTWNGVRVGGQQAGVGPGGNNAYYDQIRVTKTSLDPGGTPPPNSFTITAVAGALTTVGSVVSTTFLTGPALIQFIHRAALAVVPIALLLIYLRRKRDAKR